MKRSVVEEVKEVAEEEEEEDYVVCVMCKRTAHHIVRKKKKKRRRTQHAKVFRILSHRCSEALSVLCLKSPSYLATTRDSHAFPPPISSDQTNERTQEGTPKEKGATTANAR